MKLWTEKSRPVVREVALAVCHLHAVPGSPGDAAVKETGPRGAGGVQAAGRVQELELESLG